MAPKLLSVTYNLPDSDAALLRSRWHSAQKGFLASREPALLSGMLARHSAAVRWQTDQPGHR
jgi:hypothetical protein